MIGRTRRSRRSGLTLIEVVMTIAIVGILVSMSAMYIRELIRLWDFMSFRNEITAQGRAGMGRMAREIRQVRNDTSVLFANASRFRFVDINDNTIDYYVTGSSLIRGTTSNDTLATSVRNITFVYYNNNSQAIAAPAYYPDKTDIRSMNITLNMQNGTERKSVSGWVSLRNIGN